MRISDWSSDVCSSDLPAVTRDVIEYPLILVVDVTHIDLELQDAGRLGDDLQFESARIDVRRVGDRLNDAELLAGNIHLALGALDLVVDYSGVGAQRARTSDVWGRSGAVGGKPGGRRI